MPGVFPDVEVFLRDFFVAFEHQCAQEHISLQNPLIEGFRTIARKLYEDAITAPVQPPERTNEAAIHLIFKLQESYEHRLAYPDLVPAQLQYCLLGCFLAI